MPLLSDYARIKKIEYFFQGVSKEAGILEVGCGDRWLGDHLKSHGWKNYRGLDIAPPADIIGSIFDWRSLGIIEREFDVVVAFELIEHIDCFRELHDILKPTGSLFLTSPVPHMDWLCHLFELARLNQKRTSPHNHLIYFRDIPHFIPIEIRTVGCMAQWGKFRPR
jgi:SAM-dependent methyltransferase